MTRNSTTTPSAERSLHHCSFRSEKNQRTEDKLITLMKKVCCQVSHFSHTQVQGDLYTNLVRAKIENQVAKWKTKESGCGVSLSVILVCHPHLTIFLRCTAVWAQACGLDHETSFVTFLHHRFIWRPCLSFDPCWSVGGSSITILPLLVLSIRHQQLWQILVLCGSW